MIFWDFHPHIILPKQILKSCIILGSSCPAGANGSSFWHHTAHSWSSCFLCKFLRSSSWHHHAQVCWANVVSSWYHPVLQGAYGHHPGIILHMAGVGRSEEEKSASIQENDPTEVIILVDFGRLGWTILLATCKPVIIIIATTTTPTTNCNVFH